MQAFIVLTVILAMSHALPFSNSEEQQWQKYKEEYEKTYKSEEEENMRKEIFFQKLKEFEEHNKKYEEGLVSHRVGINQFTDISREELEKMVIPEELDIAEEFSFASLDNVEAPKSIDWREKGAVTSVKNQHSCGACYAFSATGALEEQLFFKTGKLVSLSEQNIVDCSFKYNNSGCNGGLAINSFKYIKENGGIDTEESYPYKDCEEKCHYNPQNSGGTVRDIVLLPPYNETTLLKAVGSIGPISVSVNGIAFFDYTGGIMKNDLNMKNLNHAVLLVGYDTSADGEDYWIVKNSWGEKYGENGYARVIRNKNFAGIATRPAYPVV